MSSRFVALGSGPLPSPFPEGWYFVASRQEVQKAGLIHRTWMGETIVIWHDGKGNVCVADSFCPHLGADLGPAAGGRVCEGRLVRPFHGFEFDVTGRCVATPYARPPKAARLRTFETREVLGLIFVWWGNEGREPRWSLPGDAPAQDGWSSLDISTVRFPGHPQETTENSVDLGHLRYVHGYGNVKRVERASVDGPLLVSRFEFRRSRKIAGVAKLTFDVSADTVIYGLGYSYVQIREHTIGMDLRLWVLATPVDGTLVDLSLVSQVREIRKPKRWIVGLGFLPPKLRAPIMNKIMAAFRLDAVRQDVVIWSRKRYRSRPRLCTSDGEIMRYGRYCAQFYPEQQQSARPVTVSLRDAAR